MDPITDSADSASADGRTSCAGYDCFQFVIISRSVKTIVDREEVTQSVAERVSRRATFSIGLMKACVRPSTEHYDRAKITLLKDQIFSG